MSAFQFPDPSQGTTEVYNPDTGAHYVWKEEPGKWVIVQAESADPGINAQVSENTERIGNVESDCTELDGRVAANEKALEGVREPITYQIGTDKVMRAGDPSIELVDSEGYYSNVKFRGLNGIKVTSDLQAIIIDGADVAGDGGGGGSDVDPENYYTKTQADGKESYLQTQINELYVTKGSASEYVLQDVIYQPAARPGHMYTDNTLVRAVEYLSFAPTDNNGLQRPLIQDEDIVEIVKSNGTSYRYKVNDETEGNLGVEWVGGNGDDLLMATMTFTVYVYPQNSATVSKQYVDAQDALKADKSELSQYVTHTEANHTYLRDGFQSHQTINFRTAGTSTTPFKISNSTGGATVWSILAEGGSNSPVVYKTEGGGSHQFEGKVDLERVGDTKQGFLIKGRKSDGTVGDLFYAYHNAGTTPDAINYYGKVDSPNNIANKKYVDEAIGSSTAGGGGLNTEDYLTIDDAVDTFQQIFAPPGRKFKKYNGKNPVGSGQFTYFEESGQLKLGLNRRDFHGVKWLDIDFNDTLAAPVLFRIIKHLDDKNHSTVRYGAIDKITATDGGYVMCEVKYHQTNGSLSDNSNFYITIGGFL